MKKPSAKSKLKPAPTKTTMPAGGVVASSVGEESSSDAELINLLGDPEQSETRAIAPVYERVKSDLIWLGALAGGEDKFAFDHLVRVGNIAAGIVRVLSDACPAFVKGMAETHMLWPVSISAAPNYPHNIVELRKQLNIGKRYQGPFDAGKRYRGKSATNCRQILDECLCIIHSFVEISETREEFSHNATLLKLIDDDLRGNKLSAIDKKWFKNMRLRCIQLESYMKPALDSAVSYSDSRMNELKKILGLAPKLSINRNGLEKVLMKSLELPAQSSQSLNEWFAIVEGIIMALCDGDPTRSPTLQTIGKSAENKYYQQLCRQMGLPVTEIPRLKMERRADGSEKTNAWTSAKAQLKTAFKSIAWATNDAKEERDAWERAKRETGEMHKANIDELREKRIK